MKKILLITSTFLIIILFFVLDKTFSYSVSPEIEEKMMIINENITTSQKAQNLSKALRAKTIWNKNLTSKQKNILNFIQNSLYSRYLELLELEKDKKSVDIFAWWDVMISRYVWFLAQKKWRDYLLSEKNPIDWFENWITFYNLESPFNQNPLDTDQITWTFWANVNGVEFLKNIIWNSNSWVLSIANNHALDSLKDWFELTKSTLKNNEISYIWDKQTDFLLINKDWKNICFDWYSYSWNDDIYKKINEENILKSIKNMQENLCDLIVISLHWWDEYKYLPNHNQTTLAKKIIDNWADIILWHHSHIPGKVEFYKKKLIIYSLWNFVFDQNFWMTECEVGQDCIFDEKTKKDVLPTFIWMLKHIKVDFVGKYKNINIIKTQKHKINYWKIEEL